MRERTALPLCPQDLMGRKHFCSCYAKRHHVAYPVSPIRALGWQEAPFDVPDGKGYECCLLLLFPSPGCCVTPALGLSRKGQGNLSGCSSQEGWKGAGTGRNCSHTAASVGHGAGQGSWMVPGGTCVALGPSQSKGPSIRLCSRDCIRLWGLSTGMETKLGMV